MEMPYRTLYMENITRLINRKEIQCFRQKTEMLNLLFFSLNEALIFDNLVV